MQYFSSVQHWSHISFSSSLLVQAGLEHELWRLLLGLVHLGEVQEHEVLLGLHVAVLELEPEVELEEVDEVVDRDVVLEAALDLGDLQAAAVKLFLLYFQ